MLSNLHLRVRFFYELVKFFSSSGRRYIVFEISSFGSLSMLAEFIERESLRPLVPQFLSMEPGILCENPACQGVAHCGRRLTM